MDLLEQGADQGGVALLGGGQLGGEDLAALGIDREVEFAPAPPAALAMRLGQPLARAVHLQPGGVDHDVDGPGPLGLRQRAGERQAGAAPREGGVVGDADAQAEQGGQRAQQALGLPLERFHAGCP
jgi:hypothetical protein